MSDTVNQQLGSLPIWIVVREGRVGFGKMASAFPLIVDQPETHTQALISVDDIFIGSNTELLYNEWYVIEDMPELKAYLVALKLISNEVE